MFRALGACCREGGYLAIQFDGVVVPQPQNGQGSKV